MAERSRKRIEWSLLPHWAVWTIFITAGAFWLLQLTFNLWISYVLAPLIAYDDLNLGHSMHVAALAVFAAAYGVYRSAWLHPVINTPYGIWLAQTPWRYPQPLPMGPVKPVWQDVLLLSAMTLAAFVPPHRGGSPLLVPLAFFACYSIGLCFVHYRLDIHWPAYACASIVGLAVLFAGHLMIVALALAVILFLAIVPLARPLREFPFSRDRRATLNLLPYKVQPPVAVNWPANPTRAHRNTLQISIGEATAVSGTIGWLMFCFAFHNRELPETTDGMLLVFRLGAAAFVVGRLFIYCAGSWPPISIAGRIATRRFIIPGYDKVFVAPLVAASVGYLLPKLLMGIGIAPIVALPITAATTAWLALALPPRLEDWYYTGHHRTPLGGVENRLTIRS